MSPLAATGGWLRDANSNFYAVNFFLQYPEKFLTTFKNFLCFCIFWIFICFWDFLQYQLLVCLYEATRLYRTDSLPYPQILGVVQLQP